MQRCSHQLGCLETTKALAAPAQAAWRAAGRAACWRAEPRWRCRRPSGSAWRTRRSWSSRGGQGIWIRFWIWSLRGAWDPSLPPRRPFLRWALLSACRTCTGPCAPSPGSQPPWPLTPLRLLTHPFCPPPACPPAAAQDGRGARAGGARRRGLLPAARAGGAQSGAARCTLRGGLARAGGRRAARGGRRARRQGLRAFLRACLPGMGRRTGGRLSCVFWGVCNSSEGSAVCGHSGEHGRAPRSAGQGAVRGAPGMLRAQRAIV